MYMLTLVLLLHAVPAVSRCSCIAARARVFRHAVHFCQIGLLFVLGKSVETAYKYNC